MRSRRGPGIGAIVVLIVAVVLLLRPGAGGDGEDPGNPGGTSAAPANGATAEVLRVVDGDTIEVAVEGTEEDVRYIGVDTPESVQPGAPVECFGPEAAKLNERLVAGRDVRLRFDAELRDDYGRLLAYVYAGPRLVNAELVRRGYARTLTIPPNDSLAARFDRLARRAGRLGRGLWGAC